MVAAPSPALSLPLGFTSLSVWMLYHTTNIPETRFMECYGTWRGSIQIQIRFSNEIKKWIVEWHTYGIQRVPAVKDQKAALCLYILCHHPPLDSGKRQILSMLPAWNCTRDHFYLSREVPKRGNLHTWIMDNLPALSLVRRDIVHARDSHKNWIWIKSFWRVTWRLGVITWLFFFKKELQMNRSLG